jgi:hypothetical protein
LAPKSIEFLFEIPSLCSIHPLGSGPQLVNWEKNLPCELSLPDLADV